MSLNIKHFSFNPLEERCHVIRDDGGTAVIIDPGYCSQQEKNALALFIKSNALKPAAILLTHAHFDHIFGVKDCASSYGIPVYMHPDEKPVLEEMPDNSFATEDLTDGQTLAFGSIELQVIHTPGHSPGSVCFLSASSGDLFSGDTLFAGAIGRSDLSFGDYDKEIVSIMDKLMVLDGDITVHPGHGGLTTIGYERTHNPFLQPFNEKDEFGNVDGIEFNG